jgi:hypothetical protein
MRTTKLIAVPLLTAALWWAGLASVSPAQGGWRQWEVRLRDGSRLEANPLGAPDDGHLSLSVGAYERREHRIARALVQVVAARPRPGESLPAVPAVGLCEDAIVLRDGTTTMGPISLARVRWSEGVVVQRGDTVDLRHVAYLVFAGRATGSVNCRREATWQPNFTHPGFTYPVGGRQSPWLCVDECRA